RSNCASIRSGAPPGSIPDLQDFSVRSDATGRHIDIFRIQFDADEAPPKASCHQTGRAAAAERIEHHARNGCSPMAAGGHPTDRSWRRKWIVVAFTSQAPGADVSEQTPPARISVLPAPLSVVIGWMYASPGYEPTPRRATGGAAATLAR